MSMRLCGACDGFVQYGHGKLIRRGLPRAAEEEP
jgi:hypothetical protein